jgi:uncharacterized membrane protein YhhN
MKTLLSVAGIVVILSASLTVIADYLHPPYRTLFFVFKPLTTILILGIALLPGTVLSDAYARAICLGLVFSLAGDVWLMVPGNRFLFGLVSFLIAHICYIFAFLTGPSAHGFPWPVIPLALIGLTIFGYLWPVLSASLKPAVGVYMAVIVTMTALAASRATAHISIDTLSAAIGALLFFISDAVLAIDRFRRPFRVAQAVILATYYSGQLLIALSIGLRILH